MARGCHDAFDAARTRPPGRAPPAAGFLVALVLAGCAAAGAERMPQVAVAEPAAGPAVPLADRKLVRNAYLTLEVDTEDDVANALSRARALPASLGGYVASETSSHIELRVPAPKLDEALAALAALGEVSRRDVQAEDVTAAHTDLDIRLSNLQRLRARLAELLAQAQGVQDVLAVEKELARVTEELERLEGQMRLMESQIALATIRVEVQEGVGPGPVGWVFYGLYKGVKWLLVWD